MLRFSTLETRLRGAMAQPLPGARGHSALAPRPRRPPRPPSDHLRQAAGLLLLYPVAERPHLVLTVRAGSLARHRGQVSLPGGAVESGETIEAAALREANEEIGVDSSTVRIVGALTPVQVPVSGFILNPIVALADRRPQFRADRSEVARVLDVPLDELIDPSKLRRRRRMRDGLDLDVPYLTVDGEQVWGVTAMVLSELLWLLGHQLDPWTSDVESRESPG